MLPNGDYVMSQTQAGNAIELTHVGVVRFLKSDAAKTLLDNELGLYNLTFNDGNDKTNSRGRIKAISLQAASLFWGIQANKGNEKALALVCACAYEALERRCDRIFKVRKTEQKYEQETFDAKLAYEQWAIEGLLIEV